MTTFIDIGDTCIIAEEIAAVWPTTKKYIGTRIVLIDLTTLDSRGEQKQICLDEPEADVFLRFWRGESLPDEMRTFQIGADITRYVLQQVDRTYC